MGFGDYLKKILCGVGRKLGIFSGSSEKGMKSEKVGGNFPFSPKVAKANQKLEGSLKVKRGQFKSSSPSKGIASQLAGNVAHLKGLREYRFKTTSKAIQSAGIIKKEYLGEEEIKFSSFAEIQSVKNSKIQNRLLSDVPPIDHLDKNTPKETLFHYAAALFSKPEPLKEEDVLNLHKIGSLLLAQKPVVLSRADDNIHELALQYQYTAIESSLSEMAKSGKDLQGDRIKKLIYILENVTSSYVYGRIPGKPLQDVEYLTLLKIFLHLFEMIRGHDKLKFLIGSDAYTKLLLSKEYLDQASPMGKDSL